MSDNSVASKPKRSRKEISMVVEGGYDISANLSISPFQPKLYIFPSTMIGGKLKFQHKLV